MARRSDYNLRFAAEALDHLGAFEKKHRRLIEQVLDEQLASAPDKPTRNRKPLEQPAPFGATWELRFGPKNRFRVFYDVNPEDKVVSVLAMGVKDQNCLVIGGEEYET